MRVRSKELLTSAAATRKRRLSKEPNALTQETNERTNERVAKKVRARALLAARLVGLPKLAPPTQSKAFFHFQITQRACWKRAHTLAFGKRCSETAGATPCKKSDVACALPPPALASARSLVRRRSATDVHALRGELGKRRRSL